MNRRCLLLLVIVLFGCNQAQPEFMHPPSNLPTNREEIDPWTSSLLDVDVSNASRIVAQRLKSDDPLLSPLVSRMAEFTPCQVVFASMRGHLRCVRQYVDAQSKTTQYDAIYIVQPPPEEIIQERLAFFDESLRPTMSDFLQRFAGSGEETADTAGQFAYDQWPTAEEFGYRDKSSLGDWATATLLFHCHNGDALFIKPNGATAWRVMETDETIPLASTFKEFVELYAAFRETHEVFDSWSYREFIRGRTKQFSMFEWPSDVAPSNVRSVSRKHEYSIDSHSSWYKIELDNDSAQRWADSVHAVQELHSRRSLGKEDRGLEAVRRNIPGPPPLHWKTGDSPVWWTPPSIEFRAMEAMKWYSGFDSGVGQAAYTGYDATQRTLWVYEYSCQHDRLWEPNQIPEGDVFSRLKGAEHNVAPTPPTVPSEL